MDFAVAVSRKPEDLFRQDKGKDNVLGFPLSRE
jgi:hypothetical protein